MEPRLNYAKVAPGASRALYGVEKYVDTSGLETSLLNLVKLRASQINGCGYCVDMHYKDARAEGETEQRLSAVVVWKETPFFSERERAALLWAEKVTLISVDHVPDEVYEQVRQHFNDEELVNLTMAVVAINSWNRLAITFRTVPGIYEPAKHS